MAKISANSRSGSLKVKVRLLMMALAFFAFLCGLAAFGVVYLFGSSFNAVFLPFLFLAAAIVFFGFWLSNAVVYPLEKVTLLAKSYERGVSTTIPKTSGSTETDELAQAIARLGGQVEKLVASMDEVASGNLDVVLSPAATTDRISQVFQKLLAKVSESIHAKQELEKLQKAVADLSEETASVRFGNLNAKISTDAAEVREISETVVYLIEELTAFIQQVKSNGAEARQSAAAIKKTILEIAVSDENWIQEMNQSSAKFKQIPDTIQKIFEELSQTASAGNQSLEKAYLGAEAARENLDAAGNLRRQIQEAIKRIQRLNERSQEIGKIAKTIEDLAQRTNLVALNASIQANELGKSGKGFLVISEEVERLAERAGNTGRQIFALNKTLQAEVGETEGALMATVSEAARLSKLAIETGSAISELEKYIAGVLSLQNRLSSSSNEQINEAQKAFSAFLEGISDTESSLAHLRESAAGAGKVAAVLDDLQALAANFKIPSADTPQIITNYPSPEANVSA